ncbi:16S rRNA (adenine(1518)-N(6)/adenine(1519)-N(6))-dimethyltransferase RsmA [Methanocella sp. MCL-LM]|uniref:16S rRNA (adenine(1518)-N(6)/adenine(1519)-N(6))- dimethyltransferase RsmA n=1 Tax=Methanocella sp. MCL-LM TaxID=3412035 RepID=UPI003C72579C
MDLAPDKRKDQHFLVDQNVLHRIVDAASLSPDEDVLEIGAGPGNLTRLLAQKSHHVYTIEMDRRFAEALEADFRGSNVTVLQGNALKVDFPRFDKVVANLPYSISSDVTFKLLRRPFKFAVLMYQREFALRMAARAGEEDYSRLSVTVQHFADVKLLFNVSRRAFNPQPEVESTVVKLTPRPAGYTVADEELFMKLVTAAFAGRRKKLRKALLNGAHMMSLKDPQAILSALPPEILDRRAEQVSPEEFALLANEVARLVKHDSSDLPG